MIQQRSAWLKGTVVLTLAVALASVARADGDEAAQAKADVPEGCPKPRFLQGKQVWYSATMTEYEYVDHPSACERAYGSITRVLEYENRQRRLVHYRCVKQLLVPESLVNILDEQEKASNDEATPPTKRKSRADLWNALVARAKDQFTCPSGMKRAIELDWNYAPTVGCYVDTPVKQFCPRPGTEPMSKRGENGEPLVTCAATKCQEGEVDLAGQTKGELRGCLRCPAGVPDLKETAAWKAKEISLGFAPDVILCRAPVGAACKVASKTRQPQDE